MRLLSPAQGHGLRPQRALFFGLVVVLGAALSGCGGRTALGALPPLPRQVVRAIGTTGDVIVPPSPKERAQAKAAMAKLPAAERSALAQLPRGSKVVSGSLFVLADAPGTGGPRRLLTWVLQTVPKGGYPVPSCGPVLLGHRPHCPTYNLRVDYVNALTGKWVMATETSTVVGRRSQGAGGQGVVVGGIQPCEGIVGPPVAFVAGLVEVLRGTVHFAPNKAGSTTVLPRRGVAAQAVSRGQQYHFWLTPGRYVLRLLRDSSHPRTEPPLAFASVTVVAGSTVHANIPDACI